MSYSTVSTIYFLLVLEVLARNSQCFNQPPINPEFHSPQDYYRGNLFEPKRLSSREGANHNNNYENRDVRFDDGNTNQMVFSTPRALDTRFNPFDRFQGVFRKKSLLDGKNRNGIASIRVNGEEVRVHRIPDDGITPKGAILLRLEQLNNVREPVKVFISPFVPRQSNDKLPSSANDVVTIKDYRRDPFKKFSKTTATVPKMWRIDQPSPAQYSQLDPTYHVEARTSNPLRPLPKPLPRVLTTESPNSIVSHFARGAAERRLSQNSERNSRVLELSNHLRDEKPYRSSQEVSHRLPNVPRTSFLCSRQLGPGYYADTELDCQVFHTCDMEKRKNSFFCPNGTLFSQVVLVCDWEQNVECGGSELFYNKNIATYDQVH